MTEEDTSDDLVNDIKEEQNYDAAYGSMQNNNNFSIYKIQLDVDQEIKKIEMNMKGFHWNYENESYTKSKDSVFPENIVNEIISNLRIRVNPNNILSFINDEKDIKLSVMQYGLDLTDYLFLIGCKYKISRQILDMIVTNIMTFVERADYRAYKGKTMQNMSPNLKTLAREGTQGQQDKEKLNF